MTRLIGPDEGSRLVLARQGVLARLFPGDLATFYADAAATTLANIQDLAGAAIASAQLVLDDNSFIPLFKFPDNVDTIWVRVTSAGVVGPVSPVYARTDDRIDAVNTALAGLPGTYGPTAPGMLAAFSPVTDATMMVRNGSIYAPNRARFTATKFPKWLAALAAQRAGSADARILCVGDSTTQGTGSSDTTIPARTSYPVRLATLLNTYFATAAPGLVIPDYVGSTDARWAITGSWVRTGGGLGLGGNASFSVSTPFTGALTFTDTRTTPTDTYDVYYIRTAASGTITVTATGGTPVVQSTTNATGAIGKVTVSAGAAALGNVVTIVGSVGICYIVGIEPRLSTTKKVLVANAGVASCRTAAWVTSPTTFGAVPIIQSYAPHLTIIALGINDATDGVTSGTFTTNIQTIATAAAISGDVVIMSMIPTDASVNAGANATNEALYVPALAGMTAYPFADVYTRAGSALAYQNLGCVYSDKIHGTDAGYADIAQMLFTGIISL